VRLSLFSIKGEIPMAETKDPGHGKTLEMRVAELEDKLAQLHISEEEMQTYHKVASKLGAAAPSQQCTPCMAAQAQQPMVAPQLYPIYYRCYYYRCYYYHCYYYNDCILATGPTGGAGGGGGGFGGFGT
jgi:hypothetical protein